MKRTPSSPLCPVVLLHKETLEVTHMEGREECNAKPCFLPEESRLSFPLWPQDTDYHWWDDAHALSSELTCFQTPATHLPVATNILKCFWKIRFTLGR